MSRISSELKLFVTDRSTARGAFHLAKAFGDFLGEVLRGVEGEIISS